MADNPKRDEKRDAKIEEKRRKLAEQRIRRAQETVTYEPEDFDYSSEKLREKSENRPQKESKKDPAAERAAERSDSAQNWVLSQRYLYFCLLFTGYSRSRTTLTSERITVSPMRDSPTRPDLRMLFLCMG